MKVFQVLNELITKLTMLLNPGNHVRKIPVYVKNNKNNPL